MRGLSVARYARNSRQPGLANCLALTAVDRHTQLLAGLTELRDSPPSLLWPLQRLFASLPPHTVGSCAYELVCAFFIGASGCPVFSPDTRLTTSFSTQFMLYDSCFLFCYIGVPAGATDACAFTHNVRWQYCLLASQAWGRAVRRNDIGRNRDRQGHSGVGESGKLSNDWHMNTKRPS